MALPCEMPPASTYVPGVWVQVLICEPIWEQCSAGLSLGVARGWSSDMTRALSQRVSEVAGGTHAVTDWTTGPVKITQGSPT